MKRTIPIAVAVSIVVLYLGVLWAGLHVRNFSWFDFPFIATTRHAWTAPRLGSLSPSPLTDTIRQGARIFDETPLYAAPYTGARLSCASCHAEGGIQPYASPVVGAPAFFPAFNQRAGRVISLEDRVEECFVRSENGKPIAYDGPEMKAIVAYIAWLSKPQPHTHPYVGRGLIDLPDLTPDPKHGQQIYASQCAGCHGDNGEGKAHIFPPLWGPGSFNDGAGMHGVRKMAAFVQHNMPQNRMGVLSPQEAYDVSAFIHAQPRPAFNEAYKHF